MIVLWLSSVYFATGYFVWLIHDVYQSNSSKNFLPNALYRSGAISFSWSRAAYSRHNSFVRSSTSPGFCCAQMAMSNANNTMVIMYFIFSVVVLAPANPIPGPTLTTPTQLGMYRRNPMRPGWQRTNRQFCRVVQIHPGP